LTANVTSLTPVSCNGGSNGTATVFVSGSVPPYTYLWSNGNTGFVANNLTAGTYTVTATDNSGCTVTANATITQPQPIIINFTSQSLKCNGQSDGSATASASGGTSPYTYNWSNGGTNATHSNLSAGTYTVTVIDDHSCTATASITITQPTALTTFIASTTPVSCYGMANGTATAAPTGGTGTYTYSWTTIPTQHTAVATGLTAGSYTVIVNDANGCSSTASALIYQPAKIVT